MKIILLSLLFLFNIIHSQAEPNKEIFSEKETHSKEYYDKFLELGLKHLKSGKYDLAKDIFIKLEKKKDSYNLSAYENILLYRYIARVYWYKQDYQSQIDYLLKEKKVFDEKKNLISSEEQIITETFIFNNLGSAYFYLYKINGNINDFNLSETYYLKSLEINNKTKSKYTYITLGNIADIYKEKRDFEKSIHYAKLSDENCEKIYGKMDLKCLQQKAALGFLYTRIGNYNEALKLYEFVLKNEPNNASVVWKISNRNLLGLFYKEIGNFELGEKYLLEAVSMWDLKNPQNLLGYFDTLNNLYTLYSSAGRVNDAKKGLDELLLKKETYYGKNSPELILVLNNLYTLSGDINYVKRALNIIETKKIDHPVYQTLNHNLGDYYKKKGQYDLAEKYFTIVLQSKDTARDKIKTSIELASTKIYLKKFKEAEDLLQKTQFDIDNSFGPSHYWMADTYKYLAQVYFFNRDFAKFTDHFTKFYYQQSSFAKGLYSSDQDIQKNYFRSSIDFFLDTLFLLNKKNYSYVSNKFEETNKFKIDEAIVELSEISRNSTINTSVKNLIDRNQDPTVASLKKDYQNLIKQFEKSKKFSNDLKEKEVIFANLNNLQTQIANKKNAILNSMNKNISNNTNQTPKISEIQKILNEKDIILSYYFSFNNLYVTLIDHKGIHYKTISTENEKIDENIKLLRSSLILTSDNKLKKFNLEQSKVLFKTILEPINKYLVNKKNLIIIPHKSLLSLPFEILVDQKSIDANINYAKVNWLINHYNISYYPSIYSFYNLNKTSFSNREKDFAGFGDPKFIKVASSEGDLNYKKLYTRSGVANKNEILKFNELPETKDELIFLSKIFKKSDLFLDENFSETKIKKLDLTKYKIISFASHAVLANEVNNIAEPGIILTPPTKPSELDDGILTISEIQKLNLSADTIILSACNTAGKDGSANGEGLSGLTSAFFHAGSKSLLVSHWGVETNSSMEIMKETFKNLNTFKKLSVSLAAAKRKMIANDKTSHPLFWAPFVTIGDNQFN